MSDDAKIKVLDNGPLLVSGADLCRIGIERNQWDRPYRYSDARSVDHNEQYALCRCGASANKPFCDGTHNKIEWDPSETADRAPTATRRKEYTGDGIAMTDDKALCWHAGFCVREHGKAWDLVGEAETAEDKERVKEVMIQDCPSSRLQYHEPAGSAPVEPALAPHVAVIDDGPVYVQGGIPVEAADGERYEVLNRVSLCRCGASANKPYCDGTHIKIGFTDDE